MDNDLTDLLCYDDNLTAEEYGFPVDSYGLIIIWMNEFLMN